MSRLFWRYLLWTLLSLWVAAVCAYLGIRFWYGDPVLQVAQQQSYAQQFLLEHYIDQAGPDEWLSRLNKVREITHAELELLPLAEIRTQLDAEQLRQLNSGQVVIDLKQGRLLRRVSWQAERYVGSDEDVLQIRNFGLNVTPVLHAEFIRYTIVAICLLVPIAIWSSLYGRSLQSLMRFVSAFGAGQLQARASIHKRASLFPLAQGMNQMADQIQELIQAQTRLIHAVSHELRTPIARLEFALELLHDARDPAKRIAAMQGDLNELKALVDELLQFGQLSALVKNQHSQLAETIELPDLLEDLLHEVSHLWPKDKISIHCADELPALQANRRLLLRALSNILRNACRYARQQIAIDLRLHQNQIQISIGDDGPGIPADLRQHVFTPFYRIDESRDRNSGGFGLGLAICQQAILAHHGCIKVQESELGGAEFVLCLPLTQ